MKKKTVVLLLLMMALTSCSNGSGNIIIDPPKSTEITTPTQSPTPPLSSGTENTPPPTSLDSNDTTEQGSDTPVTGDATPTPELTPTPIFTPTPTPMPTPTPEEVKVKKIFLDAYELTLAVGDEYTPKLTIMPSGADNKKVRFESTDTSVATVKGGNTVVAKSVGKCEVNIISESDPKVSVTLTVNVKKAESDSVDGITYINGILVVNKTYSLPADYDPGVQPEALDALNKMFAAAKKDGISLWICSGYRSYDYQKNVYENWVKLDGKEKAETYSARPGHSEHQTGLAFDINSVDDSFANTPEAIWIEKNAYKYGFIVRYPEGKQEITGYTYEPWHVRYLGKDIATSVYESGLTLEEYLGITSVYED